MFSKLAILTILPTLVVGQYGYGPAPGPASSPTSAAAAVAAVPSAPTNPAPGTMGINVAANGQFVFSPANITATVGTLVTFFFQAGTAHSVTQSSFANPCTYLTANTTANTPAGFDSGLVTASTFTINVTDNQPIWFHCKQVTHCGQGMVGSINAPATGNTFDNFKAAAIALGSNAPTETGPGVTGGVHGVATALPVADASQSGSSQPGPTGSGGSGGSNTKSDSVKVMASAGAAVLSAVLGGFMLL